MDLFLYDIDFRHEKVNTDFNGTILSFGVLYCIYVHSLAILAKFRF